MQKVFIDGQEGTTGLKIRERLNGRSDFQLIEIEPEKRKDESARRDCLQAADIAILCLPDDAARSAVELIRGKATRLIDSSTAHRVAPGWVYGLPELGSSQRDAIKTARFVANPGCHATAFVLGMYPLVKAGIVGKDYPLFVQSLTGYSGGGKKLIAKYESGDGPKIVDCRPYALSLNHKHVPEMTHVVGLDYPPGFLPVLGPFYNGMIVSTMLERRTLARAHSAREIHQFFEAHYKGERFIRVMPFESGAYLDGPYLPATGCNETNRAEVFVFGSDTQILVSVRLDNLGKGASGAAVQNLNLMLGAPEDQGLVA